MDPLTLFNRAEQEYCNKKTDEALRLYRQFATYFSDHDLYAIVCSNIGELLILKEEWDEAKKYLDQALAKKRIPGALVNLAHWYLKRAGDLKRAEETIQEVLAREPDRVDALFILAVTSKLAGRRKEALALFQRLTALKPESQLFQDQIKELFRGSRLPPADSS